MNFQKSQDFELSSLGNRRFLLVGFKMHVFVTKFEGVLRSIFLGHGRASWKAKNTCCYVGPLHSVVIFPSSPPAAAPQQTNGFSGPHSRHRTFFLTFWLFWKKSLRRYKMCLRSYRFSIFPRKQIPKTTDRAPNKKKTVVGISRMSFFQKKMMGLAPRFYFKSTYDVNR